MRPFPRFAAGVALICAPAGADPDAPRTTDEIVQLYATGAGYAALSGYWVQQLAGGDALAFAPPALGVAGLSLGATAWLDRHDAFALGQPQAVVTDVVIGAEIAAAWVWRQHAASERGDEWSELTQSTLLWSGATVGALAGIVRYELRPSPPGAAALVGSATLWTGTLSGLVTGALTSDVIRRDDNASLATAVGLEAGVVLGSLLGRVLDATPSIGWVRWLDGSALFGGALAAGGYVMATGSALYDRGTLAAGAVGVGAGITSWLLLRPASDSPHWAALSIAPDFDGRRRSVGLRIHGEL